MLALLLAALLLLSACSPAAQTSPYPAAMQPRAALPTETFPTNGPITSGQVLTWTNYGTLSVVGNHAQAAPPATGYYDNLARAAPLLATQNQFVQASVTFIAPLTGSAAAGVVARYAASTNTGIALYVYASGSTYKMGAYGLVNGVNADHYGTDVDVTLAATNILRFEITGTGPNVLMVGYLNGTSVWTASGQTTTSYAGNQGTGFAIQLGSTTAANSVQVDDFSAGAFGDGCTGSSPTWTTTPDQPSVNVCVDSAVDGDTINVLAGSATWANLQISNKAISLIGAGAGLTNITGTQRLFSLFTKSTGSNPPGFFRLSGFQFSSTGGCGNSPDNQAWSFVGGSGTNVRLDHNAWIANNTCAMLTIGGSSATFGGVADHNTFTINAGAFVTGIFDYSGNGHGDDSWARADNMGAAELFYFENNSIINNDIGYHVTDGWRGGRVVWRYNQFFDHGIGNHGTEASGRDRSMRQMEIYQNDFTFSNVNGDGGLASFRGGTGAIYDNRVHLRNGHTAQFALMNNQRRAGGPHPAHPWGPCGRATATFTRSGGTATATTASAFWTNDAYTCGTFPFCQIVVSGTTSYNGTYPITAWLSDTQVQFSVAGTPGTESGTFQQLWDGNTDGTGYRCMDQPGSGQSSVLTDPLNDGDVQPKAPVANALSPVYCWGNTVETNGGTPVSTGCTSTSDSIVIGRDVINGTVKPGYTSFTYPHPLTVPAVVPAPVRSIILSWTNNGGDGFTIQRKDGHCLVPGTFTDLIHVTNASHQDNESPFPYACYHVRATLAGAPDSVDSNDDGSYLPMKTAPLRGLRRR